MQGLGNPVTPTEMKIESYFMYPAAASIFRDVPVVILPSLTMGGVFGSLLSWHLDAPDATVFIVLLGYMG